MQIYLNKTPFSTMKSITHLDIYYSPSELVLAEALLQRFCLDTEGQIGYRLIASENIELSSDEAPSLSFSQGVLWLHYRDLKISSQLPEHYNFWRGQKSRDDLLLRALGLFSKQKVAQVVDGTFGQGKDSMNILAQDVSVVAFERHPMLYLLGLDGRRRLCTIYPELEDLFTLKCADLHNHLHELESTNVIYLDPMFENKSKRLAKKEMQLIQELTKGQVEQRYEMLKQCLKVKNKRVVFKGAVKERLEKQDPQLQKPNSSFVGKTVRYDLFLT